MGSAELSPHGVRPLIFVVWTFGCTIVAIAIPLLLAGAMPTHVRYVVLILSVFWMYFCAFKFAKYFANRFLFDRADDTEFQVLGAAVDRERLRGLREGKVFTGGRSVKWPGAKLSTSQTTLRVQTSFGNFSWDKAEPPLIVRGVGWEIGSGTFGEAADVMFYTSPWKAVTVERKLAEFGY